MKKVITILVVCILIACSILTITVTASEPTVLLPTDPVIIKAQYGTNYWFDYSLSNVSGYYDVENGIYYGWCVQKDAEMTRGVNHSVILMSSLETNLPNGFDDIPWHEINYIINNRQGYSRNDTQMAIWYFTDNVDLSGYEDSQELVDKANQYGSSFVPQSDQKLAIPIVGVEWIQLAFLELIIPPPSLQGFVWYDTDADGVQDETEIGIGSAIVNLYDSSNVSKGQTQTNSDGIYSFGTVAPGDYYLKFTLKSEYVFTKKDIGDDTLDSDADPITGKTIIFTIPINQNISITNWDAGMYKPTSGGTPEPPEEEPVANERPTADATAGEPYQGFVNSSITFNGSLSYDLDGRIISYRWNFGDGTNSTGEIAAHIYTLPGTYTVNLLVMDDDFATDMYTTTARITLGNNPPEKPTITGPVSGNIAISYQYTIIAIDPDGDSLKYFVDWDDGTEFNSSFSPSGISVQPTHKWNAPGFYQIEVYVQDPYNELSEISKLTVAIDVTYVKDYGYLIDVNSDGIFDRLYRNATGIETEVKQQNGNYLIDSDGDGTYDLIYDPVTDQIQQYSEQPLLLYVIIIIAILIVISLLIFYLLRKRK